MGAGLIRGKTATPCGGQAWHESGREDIAFHKSERLRLHVVFADRKSIQPTEAARSSGAHGFKEARKSTREAS